jgi:hypothetical protein
MSSIRPVWSELDFGDYGWRRIHELARQRRRHPRDQFRALVLFALDRDRAGEDVELSAQRLESLLADLESVA